ncbi:unnamed protein product, partial [Urochloa humidicola]
VELQFSLLLTSGQFFSDALLIIGLPDGPTAHFKLSILVLPEGRKGDLLVDGSFFWFSEQEVD